MLNGNVFFEKTAKQAAHFSEDGDCSFGNINFHIDFVLEDTRQL